MLIIVWPLMSFMYYMQDLESLHQSRKTAYQRFISHQDQVKRASTRWGHTRGKAALNDSPRLHQRRGGLTILSMSISHQWIQRSRNVEVNKTDYVHTPYKKIHCSLSKFLTFVIDFFLSAFFSLISQGHQGQVLYPLTLCSDALTNSHCVNSRHNQHSGCIVHMPDLHIHTQSHSVVRLEGFIELGGGFTRGFVWCHEYCKISDVNYKLG